MVKTDMVNEINKDSVMPRGWVGSLLDPVLSWEDVASQTTRLTQRI